ncbi:MAG: class I SAM-dependent methyltransferase [Xenococcaceae cyanobacterium]
MTKLYPSTRQLNFIELSKKYDNELCQVARNLREKFHIMQSQGYGTTFGDVEGEIMYMVIRETQPEIAFEISPNAGWSSNYILAALSANGKGTLHSFELLPRMQGKPTEEVIRGNQCSQWEQQRLVIHIGDARETVPSVKETINFLLIDSCHEDWFAEWYVNTVFPRVEGPVIVQDIAFVDQMERSSESEYVWTWAQSKHIQPTLIGAVEADIERVGLRAGYPERRGLRSNSIHFWLPMPQSGELPVLAESPADWLEQARKAIAENDYSAADLLLNQAVASLMRSPTRVNRHRLFFQAGECYAQMDEGSEAQRCFQRALGVVLQADTQQRLKGLPECFESSLRHRQWRQVGQTFLLMLLEPKTWLRAIQIVPNLARTLVRKILKKN